MEEFKYGPGIWEELKSYHSAQSAAAAMSHSAFDFVTVDLAQFRLVNRLPKSIVVLLSVVAICILFSYNCCHTPNKLDSSANEIYGI